MSDFSPLRDPFCSPDRSSVGRILFALLGISAGMTRRPWYIAPTLFLVPL
jgi:hypothetical protein